MSNISKNEIRVALSHILKRKSVKMNHWLGAKWFEIWSSSSLQILKLYSISEFCSFRQIWTTLCQVYRNWKLSANNTFSRRNTFFSIESQRILWYSDFVVRASPNIYNGVVPNYCTYPNFSAHGLSLPPQYFLVAWGRDVVISFLSRQYLCLVRYNITCSFPSNNMLIQKSIIFLTSLLFWHIVSYSSYVLLIPEYSREIKYNSNNKP